MKHYEGQCKCRTPDIEPCYAHGFSHRESVKVELRHKKTSPSFVLRQDQDSRCYWRVPLRYILGLCPLTARGKMTRRTHRVPSFVSVLSCIALTGCATLPQQKFSNSFLPATPSTNAAARPAPTPAVSEPNPYLPVDARFVRPRIEPRNASTTKRTRHTLEHATLYSREIVPVLPSQSAFCMAHAIVKDKRRGKENLG